MLGEATKDKDTNGIIYILGMFCFMRNLNMKKIYKNKPEGIKKYSPAYLMTKDGKLLYQIGFEKRKKLIHFYNPDSNEDKIVHYDYINKVENLPFKI